MHETKIECLSPEAWHQWHRELLQSNLNRVYQRVPFYRKAMDRAGVAPGDIQAIADLQRLPFTTRQDLALNYPYDIFAVPLRDVVRIHALRTAQRTPVVLGYTRHDLEHRQALTARFLMACGVTPDDIVQICLDPGMAIWGQELKEGAEVLGALVIPPDPVSTSAQLSVLADFKTTVLITTPSYGLHLLERLGQNGIPLASLSLRRGIFVGDTLTEDTRQELQDGFAITAFSGYGTMETMGPGLAYECGEDDGLHLAMDHVIPEVVSPETGERLPFGETGELVITTVTTRANPMLRFRTGDLTRLIPETCRCGRTTWRMAPVEGRCDNLIAVRGVKMDPSQLDAFISSNIEGEAPPFVVALRTRGSLKRIELWIALGKNLFSGSLPELHDWIRRLENAFEETMGLRCRVRPVEHRTILPYLSRGECFLTVEED